MEERNLPGAMIHNRAMQMVSVKKIETAVLIAKIWPNLANSWMTVKHNGIDAATVVTAELSIAVPIWDTAANVLQRRLSWETKQVISITDQADSLSNPPLSCYQSLNP